MNRTWIPDLTDSETGRILGGEPIVVVEQNPDFPDTLLFQALDQARFTVRYHEYLSHLSTLNDPYLLTWFEDKLAEDGWELLYLPSAEKPVAAHDRWSEPLEIDGLVQPLYPFQQFSVRRAMELGNFFFNFAPGTGKGNLAAAGAQELVANRGEVELVLLFTRRRMKTNMARRVEQLTGLEARVIDGARTTRHKRYASNTAPVLVFNYDKAHVDHDELAALVSGRSVLFVLDEVQDVLFGENAKPNRNRLGLERLVATAGSARVWSMSGSVVKQSPLRYHDVFAVQERAGNPLGTREDYVARYCDKVDSYEVRPHIYVKRYVWNTHRLNEVRHRVVNCTQALRKTSPGVREFFKGMTTEMVPVQMSPEDRKVYDIIVAAAELVQSEQPDASFGPFYRLLQYVCNTAEALAHTSSEIAAELRAEGLLGKMSSASSAKFEMIADKLAEIRDAGDQAVVFSHWTNLSLFPLARVLDKAGVKYVLHHGEMSDKAGQEAQDRFIADPSITAFLSSDAGSSGLNFQNARYVLNVECPYDPDLLTQRNDRIDRADSYLDGLTSYVYVVESTVEERIWRIQEQRRKLSSITQGTTEALSRFSEAELLNLTEEQAMNWLLFGHGSSLDHR